MIQNKNNLSVILIFILLFSYFSKSAFSQGKNYPVNLSLWYSALSINKSDKDNTAFNLNLLYSKIGSLKGFGLGVAYTNITEELSGFNLTGGITKTSGKFEGLSVSGLAHTNRSIVKGIQIAGITNIATDELKGAQISGLVNYLLKDMKGLQTSAIINISSRDVQGVQIGNSNVIGDDLEGVQIGTTFNAVHDKMSGVQIAPGNVAHIVNGGQAGLINVAGENNGLQLGLINISDYQYGVPVGVLNIATKNGFAEWITYSGNFESVTTGIKIRAANFVSILEAGYNEYQSDDNSSYTLGVRYGYDFEVSDKFIISPDIGYVEIFNNNTETEHQFAVQGRLLAYAKLSKFLRFFAGGGYSERYDINRDIPNTNNGKFIYLAGFSLF